MKICLISGHYPPVRGGVADYAGLLAGALSKKASLVPLVSPPFSVSAVSGLVRHIAKEQCTGVIVLYTPNLFGWRNLFPVQLLRALQKKGIPTLAVFHEIFLPSYRGLWRNLLMRPYNFAKDWLCLKSTRFPVVTFTHRALEIKRRFGVECRVVPAFSNLPSFEGLRLEKQFLFGTFGTYHDDFDLSCLNQALEAFPKNRALYIGEAPKGAAETAGRFSGYLPPPDAARSLREMKYFVLADRRGISFRKGASAAALEAGLPVIATQTAWTDPEFRHGENVYFFDGSPQGLVSAIRTLEAGPALANKIAEGGHRLYESRMSLDHAARTLLSILSEAA